MGNITSLVIRSDHQVPLDRNPAAIYLAHLSSAGRPGAKWALNLVAKALTNGQGDCMSVDWSKVRYQHTSAVRTWLSENYAAATVNHALCTLRGTLKQAWLLGLISAEEYMRTIQIDPVRGETLLKGRQLSFQEIKSLVDVCTRDKNRSAGRRDAAMIAGLYVGGLRREEVTKVELADYDQQTGRLLVHGKENKERLVYMTNESAQAMADWLAIRGPEGKYLFVPVNRTG